MTFISKLMEAKDSFDICGHSHSIVRLLVKRVHCLEKPELKSIYL